MDDQTIKDAEIVPEYDAADDKLPAELTAAAVCKRALHLRSFMEWRTKKLEKDGPSVEEKALIAGLLAVTVAEAQPSVVEACHKAAKLLQQLLTSEIAYKAGMTSLENAADVMMRKTEQTALRTLDGTAYYEDVIHAKVSERDKWFDWVFENGRDDMLTTHLSKEVKTHIDEYKEAPPGIKYERAKEVRFRKPS